MIAELWLFVPDVDLVSCGPLGDLGLLMLDPVWGHGVHRWRTETGGSALSTKILLSFVRGQTRCRMLTHADVC